MFNKLLRIQNLLHLQTDAKLRKYRYMFEVIKL
jgi:hypothetical protein